MAEVTFVATAEVVGELDIVESAFAAELEGVVAGGVVVDYHRSWQPTPG